MGESAATNVRPAIVHVDGHDICRVQVDPCRFRIDFKVIYQQPGGPKEMRTEFFVRVANGTRALKALEREKYILGRWGSGDLRADGPGAGSSVSGAPGLGGESS